jgi:DNA polymerase I-like protein with 3'-5' exonuclease and polymerase domains
MHIVEYGKDTTYMLVFSNGVIDSIREQFRECIVIDLQAKTVPTTKRFLTELETEIAEYNPSRILAIGTVASKVLLKERYTDIRKCHGGLFAMSDGSIVVPVYEQYASRDIERAKTLQYEVPEYIEVTDLPTLQGDVYLDIETDSLEANTITSIQIGDNTNVYYIANPSAKLLSDLYYYLLHRGIASYKLIGHNLLSFDLPALAKHTGKDWLAIPEVYDTMILAHNRGLKPLGLKHLTTMYTSVNNPDAYAQAAHSFDTVYAVADIVATRALYQRLVRKGIRPIDNLTMQTAIVFQRAHQRGIAVNRDTLITEQQKLQVDIDTYMESLEEYGLINWQSNKEVSDFLTAMGVPLTELTQGGNYSVASKALEDFRDWEVVDTLLKYRESTKLLSTFYDKYVAMTADGNNTIHPEILITGTDTGRSSSRNPNIQQTSSDVKKVFVSRYEQGYIASFDLAQSELRCAAILSGDSNLADDLNSGDMHKKTAASAFGIPESEVTKDKRQLAKMINFGNILYLGSVKGIANRSGADEKLLEKVSQAAKERYHVFTSWQEYQIQRFTKTMKLVDTFGRIRDLEPVKANGYGNGLGSVKRAIVNTPVQALSAYLCYYLGNYIEDRMPGTFIANVHDAVYCDIPATKVDEFRIVCIEAFEYLNHIPELNTLPGWYLVSVQGELTFADTMNDYGVDIDTLLTSKKEYNEQ